VTLQGRFSTHNFPTSRTEKNSTHAAIAIQKYDSKAEYYTGLDQQSALPQIKGM